MLTKYFFYFLLLCNFVIPIIIITRRFISRRGVEIDHVFLFSCGFIFYWILPIALGVIDYISVYKESGTGTSDLWYSIFNKLTDYQLITYMLCTLVFYISFVIGDSLSNKIAKHPSRKPYPFDKRLLDISLLFSTIMAVCFAYPLWDKFFTGYTIQPIYLETGPLTAVTALLLSIAFMNVTNIHAESGNSLRFFRALFNKAFIIYLIFAILLVSLGGRLIFVSSILMICVLYSVYFKRIKLWHTVLAFFAIIVVSHIIIIFRMNSLSAIFAVKKYAINDILLFLFSDNVNTSLSLIHFLSNNAFPVFQFPTVLLSYLIGIIPAFIFPTKCQFFVSFGNLGYEIFTPFGGLNSFVSLVINFGTVGTVIFLFCFSFFLGWLKTKLTQPYQTMYVMTCGWLAISFFRTFEMAMTKLIFQFSILAPFLITIILVIISNIRPKKDG